MLLDRVAFTLSQAAAKNGLAIFLGPQVAGLIESALQQTERKEKRRRTLLATLMVYLLVAMVMYRSLSMPNVLKQLFIGLRILVPGGWRDPAESSLIAARTRLGFEPIKVLFESAAAQVTPPPTFHGFRAHAMDGVRFPVADTPENEQEFGRPKSRRGKAGHPVARVVTLVTPYSHEPEAIDIARWDAPEQDAVWKLIAGLGSQDVVILDRLYPSGLLFHLFQEKDIKVVARINSVWKPTIVRTLGVGDYLVEIKAKLPLTPEEQATRPRGRGRPAKFKTIRITLRMLVYECGGKDTIRLLTTLPLHIPAIDIAQLYHDRWEVELVNDEIKNHLASPFHGTEELCFRSKSPDGVKQDIYATFTTHLLIRQTMRVAAEAYELSPLQISFTDALNTIRRSLPVLQLASPKLQAVLIPELYQEIALDCQLRPRRNRQYPRKVKVKMSDFKCKTAADVQTKIDYIGQTRMVKPAPPRKKAA